MRAQHVLANVAPWVLRILLGDSEARDRKPAGSQLKINFLLSRLPRLKSGDDPEEAFAGTFHVAEEYSALERSFREASAARSRPIRRESSTATRSPTPRSWATWPGRACTR